MFDINYFKHKNLFFICERNQLGALFCISLSIHNKYAFGKQMSIVLQELTQGTPES